MVSRSRSLLRLDFLMGRSASQLLFKTKREVQAFTAQVPVRLDQTAHAALKVNSLTFLGLVCLSASKSLVWFFLPYGDASARAVACVLATTG